MVSNKVYAVCDVAVCAMSTFMHQAVKNTIICELYFFEGVSAVGGVNEAII